VTDTCASSACTSGPRISAAGLATSLVAGLPPTCGEARARVRRALARHKARASAQVERGVGSSGRAQARAFARARRLLGRVAVLAKRLRRRGAVACADAVAVRVTTAGVQLDCVASDATAPAS
jgi:hypothetical protein